MNKKRLLSLPGCTLIILGVFTPVLTVPVLGKISYLVCGKGDGTLIIILAVASLIFSFKNKYQALWYTSVACAVIVTFTFFVLQKRVAELQPAASQTYHLSWGWAVLVIGVGTLMSAAILKESSLKKM